MATGGRAGTGTARTALVGAAHGVAATVAMSVPMLVVGRRAQMATQPPKRITVDAMEAAGVEPATEAGRNLASTLAHLCFGAVAGAVFAVLRGRLRPPGPAVSHGGLYGLGVWAVSYRGWVPALGIMPAPRHDEPVRQRTTLGAHLLYGAVLGLLSGIQARGRGAVADVPGLR